MQIHFKFNDGTNDSDVKTGLADIGQIAGIFNTEALFSNETDPELKLMYFSIIDKTVNPKDVVDQVKALPNIQYAHVPPIRRAI